MLNRSFIITVYLLNTFILQAQDSLLIVPQDYLTKLSCKINRTEELLATASDKILDQLMTQEKKIKQKLIKMDSSKAQKIFGNIEERYKNFQIQSRYLVAGSQYIPALDTIISSLKFLKQNPGFISQLKNTNQNLNDALAKVADLQEKFKKAGEIKSFLKERTEYIKQQIGQLGFVKELRQLNKHVYYYAESLKEIKSTFADHKKIERKVIGLLCSSELFQSFMRKNSLLASLFRIPPDPGDPLDQSRFSGLQTREQLNSLVQQQLPTGGTQQQFTQHMQEAGSSMHKLQNKLSSRGRMSGDNSDDIMPDGFRPNNQKTKRFLKRLEFGTFIQTHRTNNFFPIITDIGVTIGYKLNEKSIIGIGGNYRIGTGQGWNHVKFTNEGAGWRSFLDWKLQGSLWIAGGYECNYKYLISPALPPQDRSGWRQSGLIGVSKVLKSRNRLFKKTKLQLLWDFLGYQQIPQAQPFLLRAGYNF